MSESAVAQVRHIGLVSSKRKSFGFIKSLLPTDTFFHKSACEDALFEELQPEDAVVFELNSAESSPGKRVAKFVARSNDRPVLQQLQPEVQHGRLVKTPDSASSKISNHRSGLVRFIAGPLEKVQHATFSISDLAAGVDAADLEVGQPVAFQVMIDRRQRLLQESKDAPPSSYAVHAYMHTAQLVPLNNLDLVSLSRVKQQQLDLLDTLSDMFDDGSNARGSNAGGSNAGGSTTGGCSSTAYSTVKNGSNARSGVEGGSNAQGSSAD